MWDKILTSWVANLGPCPSLWKWSDATQRCPNVLWSGCGLMYHKDAAHLFGLIFLCKFTTQDKKEPADVWEHKRDGLSHEVVSAMVLWSGDKWAGLVTLTRSCCEDGHSCRHSLKTSITHSLTHRGVDLYPLVLTLSQPMSVVARSENSVTPASGDRKSTLLTQMKWNCTSP